MKKILAIGSTGMAGHVITKYLEQNKNLDVYNISRSTVLNDRTILVDVTEFDFLENYLSNNEFDIVINCTGILNQYAEQRKDRAVIINSYLPHFLENKYLDSSTKVIHLSTDCVFSGKTGSYAETDIKDGDTFYDRSKALGELNNEKDLTFRMSIIGPDMKCEGTGLFNWFMKTQGEIEGYKNAIWTGVTTIQLAKAIEAAINQNLSGLYHLVPNSSISKYELLLLIKTVFNKETTVTPFENTKIDKSLINHRKDFNFIVPSYQQMIQEMKNWIVTNEGLYPHYFKNSGA
ncbi:MAG TPA: sugar nucleotide-binding protein [Ruminiclostridium sp.]